MPPGLPGAYEIVEALRQRRIRNALRPWNIAALHLSLQCRRQLDAKALIWGADADFEWSSGGEGACFA